jgi:cell division septal protein FtsQ
MGWILTSKKKQAQEQEAEAAAVEAPVAAAKQVHWNPASTLMKVRIGLGVVSLVAVGFGYMWMSKSLETYAAARLDNDDTPVASVELAGTPAWMDTKLCEQLQGVAGQKISNDPMAGKELAAAYNAFSNNPWVESVKSVRRTASGGVVIEATYRKPVALVEQHGSNLLRLVDAKGVMLPWEFTQDQKGELHKSYGLPVIKGVRGQQPEADGEVWNSPDLIAGLGLIKQVSNEPYYNQVVAYDVGRRDSLGRVRLAMVTKQAMIDWGAPVGQEQAIEPAPEHKLKLVADLFKADQRGSDGTAVPLINTVGNRMANVYGQTVTYSPLPSSSHDNGRIEYTRGR